MDRRLFALGSILYTTFAAADPQTREWKAGTHYIVLSQNNGGIPIPSGRIQVIEAFSYSCIHCYHFEPFIQEWLKRKPTYVDFVRIPGIWNSDRLRAYAQMYYTLQLLNRNDLDSDVFAAIHRDKTLSMSHDANELVVSQITFASQHGISESAFRTAYYSNEVTTRLASAANLLAVYQVTGTPSVVIDGKYLTDPEHAANGAGTPSDDSFRRLVALLDQLTLDEAASLKLRSG
jgi:thiol:disulfide interchange protein DsbA